MLSRELFGLAMLLVSAMLFSVMGCFVKLASETGIPSTELVLIRATFQGSLVIAGMCCWKARTIEEGGDRVLKLPRPLLWTPFGGSQVVMRVVVVRGLVGGLGFIMYFYTIAALPLGDAVTLFSLYPIFTVFLATAFLGEPIRSAHLLATASSAVGAVLIARPTFIFGVPPEDGFSPPASSRIGYWTAAIGSCCAGAVIVLIRKAGKVGAHTLQLLFSWATFSVSFSVLFAGFLPKRVDGAWCMPPSREAWCYILGMCTVGSVAHFLLNYAGRMAPAGLGSIVRSSDIMWAYLFEIFIFRQIPTITTWAGVVFICFSLVVVAIQKVNEEQNKKAACLGTESLLHKDHPEHFPAQYGSISDEKLDQIITS